MRDQFIEYLVNTDAVDRERLHVIVDVFTGTTEPLGLIALSHGLLTGSQINKVMEAQRQDSRPFAEIAQQMKFLNPQQAHTLLEIQKVRVAAEIAEALALSGDCTVEQVMGHLARFLVTVYKPAGSGTQASP
jgi:hypothetical protein